MPPRSWLNGGVVLIGGRGRPHGSDVLDSEASVDYWMRIAPFVYNDMRDVERLLEALS